MLVILNKNIHLNLTMVFLGSWLSGLSGIFLTQEKVSLAYEEIYNNNILESNHFLPEESLDPPIVFSKLSEEKLNIEHQFSQNIDSSNISFATPKQKTKLKTVTKSDFYLPKTDNISESEIISEPEIQAKIVAKPNPELILSKTIELIREFEGFRSHAYRDTDGTPVIGYGLSKIAGKRVRMGDRIAVHQAEAALKAEIQAIQAKIKSIVKVELNDYQLGALTSFAFNTGFYGLKNSTLLRKLNAGDHHGAANEFLRWNKAHSGGRLVPLAGLTRRRQAEKQLFLTAPTP